MIDLRAMRPGDELAVADLVGAVYGKALTPAWFGWRYAGTDAIVWLAWDGPRLVAQYMMRRMRMQCAGRAVSGCLSMHTATHPDYRGRGLFVALAEAAYADAVSRGVDIVYGFPNDQSMHGFLRRLNWSDMGDIVEWTMPVSTREPDGGPLVSLHDGPGVPATASDSDATLLAVIRDADYLRWRYDLCPIASYERLSVEVHGEDVGEVVCKFYAPRSVFHICEYMARASWPDHGMVLRALARRASERGASALTCWALPGMKLHELLNSFGFTRSGISTHFGGRSFGTEQLDHRRMYISMGDSDVF